jgi:hypothetical protein
VEFWPAFAELFRQQIEHLLVRVGFATAELIYLSDRRRVVDRAPKCLGDFADRDRLEFAVSVSNDGCHRRLADLVGEDVDEAIAWPEDDRRAENGPVESGTSDRFLRTPLGVQVWERWICLGAERAHVDEAPDTGGFGGTHHVLRALPDDPIECRPAGLLDDRNQVNDSLAASRCPGQRIRVCYISLDDLH